MPKIIKDQQIVEDNWTLLVPDQSEQVNLESSVQTILPLALWLTHKGNDKQSKLGVMLTGSDALDNIIDSLESIPVIAIEFPLFTDGRGYSLARRLRARHGYSGEIRAVGDVLLDQLFYMKRCGFNSFSLREESQYETALEYFNTINLSYQESSDERDSILQQRLSS